MGVCIDGVFETDPGEERGAKGEIEQALVGNGEDDECRRKRQEENDQPVKIVLVRGDAVDERKDDRRDQGEPAHDLVASREPSFGLE